MASKPAQTNNIINHKGDGEALRWRSSIIVILVVETFEAGSLKIQIISSSQKVIFDSVARSLTFIISNEQSSMIS